MNLRFGVNVLEMEERLEEAWLQAFELSESMAEAYSNLPYLEPNELNSFATEVQKRSSAIRELLQDIVKADMSDRKADDPDNVIRTLHGRRINKNDKTLELVWEQLKDEPFDEQDGELVLSDKFLRWAKGTPRKEIWAWFDERHSKGIAYLLYEYETVK